MDDEIDTLRAEVKRLEAAVKDANAKLQAALMKKAGIAIGDIVISTDHRRGGKAFRVTKVDCYNFTTWVTGNPLKKDGTFGIAERNLFGDWIKPAESVPVRIISPHADGAFYLMSDGSTRGMSVADAIALIRRVVPELHLGKAKIDALAKEIEASS